MMTELSRSLLLRSILFFVVLVALAVGSLIHASYRPASLFTLPLASKIPALRRVVAPSFIDASKATVWIDGRANMVAVVEGEIGLSDTARAARADYHSIEFEDGRRIDRAEDVLLFVFADHQEVALELKAGEAEWLRSELRESWDAEDAWADIPSFIKAKRAVASSSSGHGNTAPGGP
ncbi:MAG: hypothetical protein WD294_02415 [Phycisphaeraceae bacterium]